MKRCLIILALLIAPMFTFGQDQRRTFTLSDTIFPIGSVYTSCQILDNEKGSVHIRPEDQPCLDSVAEFIIQHPGIIIEIGCHTDQRGSDTFNIRVSQQRANRIKQYLLSRGISTWSVASVGYGETKPVWSEKIILSKEDRNEREKLYSENRRTEFKILRGPRNSFTLNDTVFQPGAIMHCNVKFQLAKSTIDSSSFGFLDSLAGFMLEHPTIEIEIDGHTDTRVSTKLSTCLSCNRARAITDYLYARGVPSYRMMSKGYQGNSPLITDRYIASVSSAAGKEELHAINRRIEIRIEKINPPTKFFRLTDEKPETGTIYSGCRTPFKSADDGMIQGNHACLDSVADFIISHPGIILEIGYHTGFGDGTFNDTRRSQVVANNMKSYLVTMGVSPDALVPIGYGHTRPLCALPQINSEPDSLKRNMLYASNNRTEFKILYYPDTTFTLNDSIFIAGAIMPMQINFNSAGISIDSSSFTILDSLASFLIQHPNIVVEIGSNTEVRTPDPEKNCLSCKRALAISDYLHSKGVRKEQTVSCGYRYQRAIVSIRDLYKIPSDEAMKAMDRINGRTEIKIIKVN